MNLDSPDDIVYWKNPAEILKEDSSKIGIDSYLCNPGRPYSIAFFKSEEDMNLYRLTGRLRENIDCHFGVNAVMVEDPRTLIRRMFRQ